MNLNINHLLLLLIIILIIIVIINLRRYLKLEKKIIGKGEKMKKIITKTTKQKKNDKKDDKKNNTTDNKVNYSKTIKSFDNNEYKIIDIEKIDDSKIDNIVELIITGKIDFPWKKLYLKEPKYYFDNLKEYSKDLKENPMKYIDTKELKPHNIYFKAKDSRKELLFPLDFSRGWKLINLNSVENNENNKNYEYLCFQDEEKNYSEMDVITDLFQEQERLKARRSDQEKSPLEFWKDTDKIKKTIEQSIKEYNKITSESLRESFYTQVREATLFKPTLVVDVITIFGKGPMTRYLDMSAGWGDRLIGAIAADVEYYLAYDPNTNLREGHQKMIEMFVPKEKQDNYCIHYEGFENFDPIKFYDDTLITNSGKMFNLIFTSPPFFDFEIYTTGEKASGQSVEKYSTLPDWMVNFLINNIKNAWKALADEGYLIIHITDVYKTIVCEPMCLLIQAEIPTAYYCGVITSVGAAGKPRPMWVFQKQEKYPTQGGEQQYKQRRSKTALQYLYPGINETYISFMNVISSISGSDEKEGSKLKQIPEIVNIDKNIKNNFKIYDIIYKSDGLKIQGYIVKNKNHKDGKLPVLIYCRGGNNHPNKNTGDLSIDRILSKQNYPEIYELLENDKIILVMSNYRGSSKSEGEDQFGGEDINDIINLYPIIKQYKYANSDNIGIYGWSRGCMMSLLVYKKVDWIKYLILVSGVYDQIIRKTERPEMYKMLIEEFNLTEKELENRSPLYWISELKNKTSPILIIHGENDKRSNVNQSYEFTKKLNENKINHKLIIYSNDDHQLSQNRQEVGSEILNFINKNLTIIGSSQKNDQIESNFNLEKIQKELNPPIRIENISIPVQDEEEKEILLHVIRDDYLTGGTKQRALALYLNKFPNIEEFIYVSPPNGYAQIALAYVSKILGKKGTVFVSKPNNNKRTELTQTAAKFGAKIMEYKKPNTMKDLRQYAQTYAQGINRKTKEPTVMILPFGLDDTDYISMLANAIKEQLSIEVIENPPKRLWLVAGSGTILRSLHLIFPDTFFNIVQVGKPIWDDILEEITYNDGKPSYKLYIAPEKFWEPAQEEPPYPSVSTYDAKLWQFVIRNAEPDDYIWNVGKDIEN